MDEKMTNVSTLLSGISSALKAIETANELKSQTSRLNNVVQRGEFDAIMGNAVVALRKLNTELMKELSGG